MYKVQEVGGDCPEISDGGYCLSQTKGGVFFGLAASTNQTRAYSQLLINIMIL